MTPNGTSPNETRPNETSRAARVLAALSLAWAATAAGPGRAETGAKPAARPAAERAGQEKVGAEKAGAEKTGTDKAASDRSAPPLIGCPSLANYRMLLRGGPGAAAAVLADPKADHLGCAALPRARITGVADRIVLGGHGYACASVKDTATCQWMETGLAPAGPGPEGAQAREPGKSRR